MVKEEEQCSRDGVGETDTTMRATLRGSFKGTLLEGQFWRGGVGGSVLEGSVGGSVLERQCWRGSIGGGSVGGSVLEGQCWRVGFGASVLEGQFWRGPYQKARSKESVPESQRWVTDVTDSTDRRARDRQCQLGRTVMTDNASWAGQ